MDNVRMQWTSVDPLAEKYYGISPYAYCAGNPVNLVDPNGMSLFESMQTYNSTHTDKDGNVVEVIPDGDCGVYKHDGNRDETKEELKKSTLLKTHLGVVSGWEKQNIGMNF